MSEEIKSKKPKFVPLTLTPEKQEELETEHEDILILQGSTMSPWLVVLRRPTRPESIGYKQHAKRSPETANEQLIRSICVYPDPKAGKDGDFERQLARWPLFVDCVADNERFKEFIGFAVDSTLK